MANYFSIFLVAISAITGLVWLAYALFFAPKTAELSADGGTLPSPKTKDGEEELPVVVDFCKQMFPIFFGVMIFRSFIYEPFQIPSGSMMPTLLIGDFILVEKFAYGLKDPVTRTEFLDTGEVKRGDMIVFKYPKNPNQDFIKRVIGLPGDVIEYRNKQLFITPRCEEGQECQGRTPIEVKSTGVGKYALQGFPLSSFDEDLLGVEHEILINPRARSSRPMTYKVDENSYFVMGDNRDFSDDSRSWGRVPEENIVGRAVFIWISFEFDRGEDDTLPTWVPTGVRFDRIGSIN